MRSRMLSDRGSRSRKIRSRFFTEGFDLECRTLLSVVDVLSYRDAQPNTNYQPNTGLNTSETSLQPSNVNLNTFGKQFETQVDGQVYAQPLVKTSVNITVGSEPGLHNVVFVATQHDSLYAMDATSGHILWKDSFIDPAHGITTVTATDVGSSDITPEIGITSTPVIDPKTNILYLVAKSKVVREVGADYLLTMHAINLADGTEALGGPADAVLCYSVLHYIYVDCNLFDFIDATVDLLAPGGRALVGDIPNHSKRRRFFATDRGQAFHRAFTGSDQPYQVPADIPVPGKIDDSVLTGLIQRAQAAGCDAYLLPQADGLPMANRRDDLLVVKP